MQIGWKDSSIVLFLSTVHTGADEERTLKKRKSLAQKSIKSESQRRQQVFSGDAFKIVPIPIVAAEYIDEMNRVDRGDELRSYTTYKPIPPWPLAGAALGVPPRCSICE
ncbi:hypothetical protein FOXYSP1_16433 [Fusarium oxysporum f. sp. phaseoli]